MKFNKDKQPLMPRGNISGNLGFGHIGKGRPGMNPTNMGYQGGQQGYHLDIHGSQMDRFSGNSYPGNLMMSGNHGNTMMKQPKGAQMNPKMQQGCRPSVGVAKNVNPSRLVPYKNSEPPSQMIVANYPSKMTNAEFQFQFSQFGEIANAYLIPNEDKIGHKGYGFVSYKNPLLAFHAVLGFRGIPMYQNESRNICLEVDLTIRFKHEFSLPTNRPFMPIDLPHVHRVHEFKMNQMQMPRPQQQMIAEFSNMRMQPQFEFGRKYQMPQIFFSNVPYSVKEEHLFNIFSEYGTVSQLYMIKDVQNGNCHKGFGFLSFSTHGSPEECCQGMKQFFIKNRKLAVDFSQKYKDFINKNH